MFPEEWAPDSSARLAHSEIVDGLELVRMDATIDRAGQREFRYGTRSASDGQRHLWLDPR